MWQLFNSKNELPTGLILYRTMHRGSRSYSYSCLYIRWLKSLLVRLHPAIACYVFHSRSRRNPVFPSASWPSRLFSSAWGVFVIFIQFIGPLIILVYCYGRIVWVLTRRIDSSLDNSEGNNSSNNLKINNTFLLARANTIKTFPDGWHIFLYLLG